jgi:hypothetical protein
MSRRRRQRPGAERGHGCVRLASGDQPGAVDDCPARVQSPRPDCSHPAGSPHGTIGSLIAEVLPASKVTSLACAVATEIAMARATPSATKVRTLPTRHRTGLVTGSRLIDLRPSPAARDSRPGPLSGSPVLPRESHWHGSYARARLAGRSVQRSRQSKRCAGRSDFRSGNVREHQLVSPTDMSGRPGDTRVRRRADAHQPEPATQSSTSTPVWARPGPKRAVRARVPRTPRRPVCGPRRGG